VKRSSVTFLQQVRRAATETVLAESEVRAVCVQKENMKPCAIAAEMLAALQDYI
jgi:acyl-CoA thioesterase FadM